MPTYTLNIEFDAADLPTIYKAKEKVVLIKQTEPGNSLAWITFDPFTNNTVDWTDNYALYASKVSVEEGATIRRLANTTASPRKRYTFNQGAFLPPADAPQLSQGQYEVFNDYGEEPWLTFGLAQDVNVNGTAYVNSPINAAVVPYKHTAKFTPFEKIKVYLGVNMQQSLVITSVASEALTLDFGASSIEQSIKYVASSGRFVLNS